MRDLEVGDVAQVLADDRRETAERPGLVRHHQVKAAGEDVVLLIDRNIPDINVFNNSKEAAIIVIATLNPKDRVCILD